MLGNERAVMWRIGILMFVGVLVCAVSPCRADDMVPVSKARLQELERKAAELDRLKNSQAGTAPTTESSRQATGQEAARSAVTPAAKAAPQASIPPITTLPAFVPGESLDASTIAAHFKTDPTGAAGRYTGKKVAVRGEISGFDSTMFIRNYKVIFRPAGSDMAVICDFYPPEKYKAVFPADDGTRLVGTLANDQEVTIARTGQQVVVEGECKGAKKSAVRLSACHFK